MQNTLPSSKTLRWTARRKHEVLKAIVAGQLSIDDACRRYRTSTEELGEWWRGDQLNAEKSSAGVSTRL